MAMSDTIAKFDVSQLQSSYTKSVLALLSCAGDLSIGFKESWGFLRVENPSEQMLSQIRTIKTCEIFRVDEKQRLVRENETLASEVLPSDMTWMPLKSAMEFQLPVVKAEATILNRQVKFSVVQSDSHLAEAGISQTATYLLTTGAAWRQYALSCLLYTSPSPRDRQKSRMPSSA